MLTHLDHLCELALFLVEAGGLLLFLTQPLSCIEQQLEVLRVAATLEEVDLSEKLLLFLLELSNFLF